jgi:hypothetical protein
VLFHLRNDEVRLCRHDSNRTGGQDSIPDFQRINAAATHFKSISVYELNALARVIIRTLHLRSQERRSNFSYDLTSGKCFREEMSQGIRMTPCSFTLVIGFGRLSAWYENRIAANALNISLPKTFPLNLAPHAGQLVTATPRTLRKTMNIICAIAIVGGTHVRTSLGDKHGTSRLSSCRRNHNS